MAANCIDKSELPNFDDETGLLPKEDSDEEDVEIEIVEEEPPFLHGHGRNVHDLSPVSEIAAGEGLYRFLIHIRVFYLSNRCAS